MGGTGLSGFERGNSGFSLGQVAPGRGLAVEGGRIMKLSKRSSAIAVAVFVIALIVAGFVNMGLLRRD